MRLMKYHLRVKHDIGNAHRTAVVLAPGALVASLWYQKFAHTKDQPEILKKNDQPYNVRLGNKAYRRSMKLKLHGGDKFDEKKFTKAQIKELEAKDNLEKLEAIKLFPECQLIEEQVYVL